MFIMYEQICMLPLLFYFSLAFLRMAFITGVQINARKISISTHVMGLVKKMLRLPPDMINAFRILDSSSFASTKDKSMGAVG